jgi:hypothetical protein
MNTIGLVLSIVSTVLGFLFMLMCGCAMICPYMLD